MMSTRSTTPDDTMPAPRGPECYTQLITRAGGDLLDITSVHSTSGLQVALYESPGYDLQVPPMDVARLSINLRHAPVHGGFGDDRRRDFNGRRYSMFLAPAGVDARWRKPQPSRHVNIYFSSALLELGADNDARAAAFGQQILLDLQRPELRAWIDALELCMLAAGPCTEEASLSLARLILARMAVRPEAPTQRLSAVAVGRLRDYIRAHLDSPLRVGDLAGVVGMPPHRFTLACAAATGTTPHRLVLECRLARALELLKDTPLPLTDIAAVCGFASQQHLTSAMRRAFGTTPGQARKGAVSAGMVPARRRR